MLQVKNSSFSYNETTILKNISFSLKEGELLSVIGESGSGKSTLLKLINGEYDLDKGDIFWNKTPILGPAHNLVEALLNNNSIFFESKFHLKEEEIVHLSVLK